MNGGHVLGAMAAQAAAQQPQVQVAQPMNDVQLVALVAARLAPDAASPRDAVASAVELVSEAIVQTRGGAALVERARQIIRERAESQRDHPPPG